MSLVSLVVNRYQLSKIIIIIGTFYLTKLGKLFKSSLMLLHMIPCLLFAPRNTNDRFNTGIGSVLHTGRHLYQMWAGKTQISASLPDVLRGIQLPYKVTQKSHSVHSSKWTSDKMFLPLKVWCSDKLNQLSGISLPALLSIRRLHFVRCPPIMQMRDEAPKGLGNQQSVKIQGNLPRMTHLFLFFNSFA